MTEVLKDRDEASKRSKEILHIFDSIDTPIFILNKDDLSCDTINLKAKNFFKDSGLLKRTMMISSAMMKKDAYQNKESLYFKDAFSYGDSW